MKFGGTSMGSAERIRTAASLCAEQYRVRPVAAVVSAMSKVTDLLLETLRHAEAGEIASAIAFLASDDAAFITGVTLDVNGGEVMG